VIHAAGSISAQSHDRISRIFGEAEISLGIKAGIFYMDITPRYTYGILASWNYWRFTAASRGPEFLKFYRTSHVACHFMSPAFGGTRAAGRLFTNGVPSLLKSFQIQWANPAEQTRPLLFRFNCPRRLVNTASRRAIWKRDASARACLQCVKVCLKIKICNARVQTRMQNFASTSKARMTNVATELGASQNIDIG